MALLTPVSVNTTETSSGSSIVHHVNEYFNIEDILASQQRVPCTFQLTVYRLGYLNPNNADEHLQDGTKMDLPFWLAKALCTRRRKIVSVEPPKSYREAQREIIGADPAVVDLQKLGPYFYALGTKLLCFEEVERMLIAESLLNAFLKRFRGVMDGCYHASKQDITTLCSRLDEEERKLFNLGQVAVSELESWEKGRGGRLTTSSVILNNRKRRREGDEG